MLPWDKWKVGENETANGEMGTPSETSYPDIPNVRVDGMGREKCRVL